MKVFIFHLVSIYFLSNQLIISYPYPYSVCWLEDSVFASIINYQCFSDRSLEKNFLVYCSSNSGCRLLNSGCRLLNSGCRLSNSGCRLSNSGCRSSNSGCRSSNSGCRLLNSGSRLLNSGCRLLFLFNFNLRRIKPKHKKTFHPVPSDALSFGTSTAPFGYAQDRLSASLRGNRAKSRFNYRLSFAQEFGIAVDPSLCLSYLASA